MWLAEDLCLCESRSLLPCGPSCCNHPHFCLAVWRKGRNSPFLKGMYCHPSLVNHPSLLLQGLWMGILCGSTLQTFLLLAVTMSTNWEQEVLSSLLCLIWSLRLISFGCFSLTTILIFSGFLRQGRPRAECVLPASKQIWHHEAVQINSQKKPPLIFSQ